MSQNFELGFNKKKDLYFGYPSLGSNYLPNLIVEERIARFIRNNPSTIDTLDKYTLAVGEFLNDKHVITKSGTLKYNNTSGSFEIYIDDLTSATNISLTLVASSDLTNGTNVENIQQPSFEYNRSNGMLYIHPADPIYKNYENYFSLIGDITSHVSLLYSFIYNTNQ